jgi:hypothetical protein
LDILNVQVIATPEKADIKAVVPLEFMDVNHTSEQISIPHRRNKRRRIYTDGK